MLQLIANLPTFFVLLPFVQMLLQKLLSWSECNDAHFGCIICCISSALYTAIRTNNIILY